MKLRSGFSLIEVMIALAILVTSFVILIDTQGQAVAMTRAAQEIVTGTNLAQEKLAEVLIRMEQEGLTDTDVCESGDFSTFGDETVDLEFGDSLEKYHYSWCVSEIDLGLAGDITSMASSLSGEDGFGGAGGAGMPEGAGDAAAAAGGAAGGFDLASLGISNEMITEMLGRYIREVRINVWWGEDAKSSEESGDSIMLTTHLVNPTGAIIETEQSGMGGS